MECFEALVTLASCSSSPAPCSAFARCNLRCVSGRRRSAVAIGVRLSPLAAVFFSSEVSTAAARIPRRTKSTGTHRENHNSNDPELSSEASHERWKRNRRKKTSSIAADNSITVKNALSWIHDMVHKREQCILESRTKTPKPKPSTRIFPTELPASRGESSKVYSTGPLSRKTSASFTSTSASDLDGSNSFSSRIRSLQTKLLATRAAIKSGRAVLLKGEDKLMQVQRRTSEDLAKAADSLEFKENEIMQTRAELRRTRAQVTALQTKMALDLSEARKSADDKQARLDAAENALKMMRFVRIVWPNAASHVLLTGSFDGWTNKIKMEKSGAGVFVTSLHLYPGRYEVKFIVDGTWRVDPCRPITYADGIENNSLIVS